MSMALLLPVLLTASPLAVVGGEVSPARAYFAGVLREGDDSALCGGVFIQKDIVLTAAHCVANQGRRLFVSAGLAVNSEHARAPLARVVAVIEHPDFDPETLAADVALLKLELPDDSRFRPEPLPVNRDPELPEASPRPLTVLGFGNSSSFGSLYLDELREVVVPLVGLALCRRGEGERYARVRASEICAGDFDSGRIDSCEGDSGSPLVQADAEGKPQVVGLVSWGEGCALPRRPGVYVRLSAYARWIFDNEVRLDLTTPFFDAKEARYVVKARCYDDFARATDARSAAGTLKLIDRYAVVGLLQEGLGEPGPAASPHCAAAGFGRHVGAEVQAVGEGEDQRLELKVTEAGRGWRAPVRLDRMVVADCKTLGIFLSSTVSQSYGQLRVDGKIFGVKRRLDGPVEAPWPEEKRCELPGLSLTVRWSDAEAEVELEADTLGHLSLGADLLTGEDASKLSLAFALEASGEGTVTATNGSSDPVFTWELQCNFPVTLTYAGRRVAPVVDEEGFYHSLVDGAAAAAIAPGGAARVAARAVMPLPAVPECRLNGLGVRTEFTGPR